MAIVKRVSRRQLLRGAALSGAGLALAACGVSTTANTPTTAPAAAATDAPAAAATNAPAPTVQATEVAGATPAPASSEKIIIRWQDWPDFEANIDKTLALAEAAIPGITVEFQPLGDNFVEKTLAEMVAGTAPDVFTGWEPEFSKFYQKGQMLDLQPLVDRDLSKEEIADFHKWQWDGMVSYDKTIRFAMPYYVNLVYLYWNRSAYDEAGVDYPTKDLNHDSYAQMLQGLVKKDGDKITRWGGEIPLWFGRLAIHVQAYGGHVVNPDDWTECWLGKDEALNALEWARARMWDDNSLAQAMQLEGVGGEQGGFQGPWAAGMLGTKEDGMGNLSYFANESKFEWDIMHLPKGPGRRATLGTTDGWGIYKGTKHPEEAWKFLTWLTRAEFQTVMMQAWAGIPCRASLITKWKEISRASYPSLEKVSLEIIDETLAEAYPMLSEQFKLQAESETLINSAVDKIFKVGDTPTDYFKEIADQVTALNRE